MGRRRKAELLTDADRARIVRLYVDGMTITDLAKRFDCSDTMIRKIVRTT